MTALAVENLVKKYADQVVLDGVGFQIEEGSFTFLLGPSGCGKTTLLRIVAGLERPTQGRVTLFDEIANDPAPLIPPSRRNIGMVFQHDALWPNMTAAGHLRFVMKGYISGPEIDQEVQRLLALVHLEGKEKRHPSSLSGGERQRLSLARALARRPRLMLLDEPTRNLDRPLAREVRAEFTRVLREEGVSALYVTHDQEEAFTLADSVILLDRGGILASGSPEELYRNPSAPRAAEMLGLTTSFRGVVDLAGNAQTPVGSFDSELSPGARFIAYFRPEDFDLEGTEGGIGGLVRQNRFLGTHRLLDVEVDGFSLQLSVPIDLVPAVGSPVLLRTRRAPTLFPEECA